MGAGGTETITINFNAYVCASPSAREFGHRGGRVFLRVTASSPALWGQSPGAVRQLDLRNDRAASLAVQ